MNLLRTLAIYILLATMLIGAAALTGVLLTATLGGNP